MSSQPPSQIARPRKTNAVLLAQELLRLPGRDETLGSHSDGTGPLDIGRVVIQKYRLFGL